MTRIIILFVVLTAAVSTSFGQGYRGKRFLAAYSPSYSMVNPSYGFDQFILYNSVKVGYTLSKHLTINVNGQYGSTKAFSKYGFESCQIKDISGGVALLYFRKFHQNYAPIGRYMGLRFDYGTQNSFREEVYIPDPLYPSYTETIEYYDDQERVSLMVISAEFGRNYLIKEKFLFGYGIQYGFIIGSGKMFSAPNARQLLKPHFNFGIVF